MTRWPLRARSREAASWVLCRLLELPVAGVQRAGAVVVQVVLDRLSAVEQALRQDRQVLAAVEVDDARPPGDAAGLFHPQLVHARAVAGLLDDGRVVRVAVTSPLETIAADGHLEVEEGGVREVVPVPPLGGGSVAGV